MKSLYFVIIIALSQCTPGKQPTIDMTMNYWLTTPDQSSLLQKQSETFFSTEKNNHPFINIDPTKTYQEMDGFGFTLTGGSAHVINRLEPAAKGRLLNELFSLSDSGIKVNYLRISIGASDLNDTVFSYNDIPSGETDINMEKFSLAPDQSDLIPLLKEIIAINPSIKIMATPWSPPIWMKDNGNTKGGSLQAAFYPAYAKYFVRYIEEMKKEGIPIYAITPQNEPLHPGNNPSLLMPAAQQAEFIGNHLGPAFEAAGISTRIIIYDHNCDKPDYPITVLNNATAKKYIDGSAFHLYAGEISAMSQVHNTHPDKNIYFTEQYTAISSDFSGDIQWHVKNLIIGAPRNWAKTVLEWNLANDGNFGPHTEGGCTTCKGALTIDNNMIKRNVAYYIIGHASKFVPSGSKRIESSLISNLPNIAYQTPSGYALIVLNESNVSSVFNIKLNDRWATITLPAGAVGSFTW